MDTIVHGPEIMVTVLSHSIENEVSPLLDGLSGIKCYYLVQMVSSLRQTVIVDEHTAGNLDDSEQPMRNKRICFDNLHLHSPELVHIVCPESK